MARGKLPLPPDHCEPLSLEELEAGLRLMTLGEVDRSFWDEHVAAFRQTVLVAIRETSEALLSPTIPPRWRVLLEGQLSELVGHLELADRHIRTRRHPADALPH